ncbi:TolC family protein [Rubinisphaera italica]|uniref:Outer membrane efflux protein n=1 Tax=Rubinisphaera italica TaxID=2527969 RepID=A0A5C5X9U5_9PLAN|nr:TolC family protein [Rubinisphaera italica]TWT59776.1 Outer membrane efflux protein [Rubinisphaera italica]
MSQQISRTNLWLLKFPHPSTQIGVILLGLALVGCQTTKPSGPKPKSVTKQSEPRNVVATAGQITPVSATVEIPAESELSNLHSAALASAAPRSLEDMAPLDYWDLTLAEAISLALENGKIVKDLGGRILSAPETVQTVYDPAIRESEPLYGVEGALSEFDAQLASSFLYSKNDRTVNNITLGGGTRNIEQNLANATVELNKTTATGSTFAMRNITLYNASNQPTNLFPSAYDTLFEFEARQPLMQGAGVDFNRIAGPNAQPGFNFSNGVLVARTNTDISIAELETGLRDFTSQVEDAYWELYFAYRNLDGWKQARDAARKTWEDIKAQQGLPGGTAEREARARVQYFIYEDLVQEALNGNPREGRSVGVYRGERRLRMLLGLPNNDGCMLRPVDEPIQAKICFDWDYSLSEALSRRSEIRKQKWVVKRDELQLQAAKNFLKPRFDMVALGRMRGFGNDLIGARNSAMRDARSGDHPEWQVGVELTVPIGFRQAQAGVRHAELKLMRDRAILREQELVIAHQVGDAISEVNRAYASISTSYNRLIAAQERLTAAQEVYQVDKVSIDLVLDAQQELAQSLTDYHNSTKEYELAKKEVYFQSGTLLSMHGVHFSEGSWAAADYYDAAETSRTRVPASPRLKQNEPGFISAGEQPQLPPLASESMITEQENLIEELPLPIAVEEISSTPDWANESLILPLPEPIGLQEEAESPLPAPAIE